ncbi:MAG TPA: bifunctional riboflavin kinase/FAD synthetase [Roseiflexaceae bacterium]|jgi:riboflavin kinase/FMN adenylyltransferase|nr:bifunctional riboflavin kinase/FAD synthetase [Roseiflexaceae bacterium]
MELVHGLPQQINARPTIMTIGAFDGIHLGHKHLIGSVVNRAHALDVQSAVLTFDPHPDLVVRPDQQRLYLTSLEERIELIEALDVDVLVVLPFTRAIMNQTAQEFMDHVCRALALRELWIGWDFALGRKREGNLARLREIGQHHDYIVHPIEPFLLNGQPVSSSRIRAALSEGDLETANRLLGRPFGLRGPVVQGDQRGRTIGFPTANVAVDELHVTPSNGVYVCRAQVDGETFGAVTNIGVRPTFDGTRRTVEAYLLDFVDDIYGETLRLDFLHRLRGEQKFNGIAELVAQINRDTTAAREWLAEKEG